jgi:hypothetical protein
VPYFAVTVMQWRLVQRGEPMQMEEERAAYEGKGLARIRYAHTTVNERRNRARCVRVG